MNRNGASGLRSDGQPCRRGEACDGWGTEESWHAKRDRIQALAGVPWRSPRAADFDLELGRFCGTSGSSPDLPGFGLRIFTDFAGVVRLADLWLGADRLPDEISATVLVVPGGMAQSLELHPGGLPQPIAFHTLLFWGLFPPSLLGALLLVDEYTAVTEREFITNPLWSLNQESRYQFERIEGVYEIGGFEGRLGPIWEVHHAIDFDDGQRWWSERGSGGPKLDQQRAMVRSVAERSGLEMELVPMREDLPVRNQASGH